MVTTFSPPVRAKKKPSAKIPVLPASLGAAAVLLLAGLVMTNNKLGKERAASAQLTDAVVTTANVLGLADVTAVSLSDATNGPAVLASVTNAAVQRVSDLNAARTEAEQAKANAARLEAEGASAQEQLTTLRSQVDAARAEAKAKGDETAAVQKKAGEESARLNAKITELETRLEQVLVDTAPEPVDVETEVVAEPDAEVSAETASAVEPAVEGKAPVSTAFVVKDGKSSLFKSVRYDAAKSQLIVLTLNDQVVTHKGVDQVVYEEMVAAPQIDIFYRFKVMDQFESEPKMRTIIHTITN